MKSGYFASAGFLFALAGPVLATPVPLALDPSNVADEGTASVYETTGGGLVTPVASANDTEFSGDIANNLLTNTGAFLGIQIDLAGATDLTQLGAYVDPLGRGTDVFKNTTAVEFFVSTDGGGSFASVGFGAFTAAALASFDYVSLGGDFQDVTNVRYRFTQGNGGSEGQRIPELVALAVVPEPGTLAAMLAGLGLLLGFRSRSGR